MRMRTLLMAAMLVLGLSLPSWAGELKVNGSTTILPIMQAAVEAFMAQHPDVNISVSGGGSGNGIKALIDSSTNIAMASREMKKEEIAMAEEKGVKPVRHIIAVDAVIPIVHPSNPVKGLTVEQLQGIFTGAIDNWKAVGGEDESIVVISRDSSSGTYETWQEYVVGKENKVTPRALLQASSGAVMEAVGKNKKSISYDGVGYVLASKSIKGLLVNGVDGAKADNAKSGKYPVSRMLQVYTNGEPTGDVKALIDFLKSPAGQKIVVEQGFFGI